MRGRSAKGLHGLVTLALWRFALRSPWSVLTSLLGVALGVASIVSVHLVSVTVQERMQSGYQLSGQGYTHVLYKDGLRTEQYLDWRAAWRAGQQGRGEDVAVAQAISHMAPVVDERITLGGRSVRVVGLDLLGMNAPLNASRRSA